MMSEVEKDTAIHLNDTSFYEIGSVSEEDSILKEMLELLLNVHEKLRENKLPPLNQARVVLV